MYGIKKSRNCDRSFPGLLVTNMTKSEFNLFQELNLMGQNSGKMLITRYSLLRFVSHYAALSAYFSIRMFQ